MLSSHNDVVFDHRAQKKTSRYTDDSDYIPTLDPTKQKNVVEDHHFKGKYTHHIDNTTITKSAAVDMMNHALFAWLGTDKALKADKYLSEIPLFSLSARGL